MILNLNSQIIWVFVDLLILFVLMKKFLFGPLPKCSMTVRSRCRTRSIRRTSVSPRPSSSRPRTPAQLASAKQEAAQIIEDARARGQQEYDRLVAEAQTAVQRLDEQATAVGSPSGRRCSVRRKRRLPLSFC